MKRAVNYIPEITSGVRRISSFITKSGGNHKNFGWCSIGKYGVVVYSYSPNANDQKVIRLVKREFGGVIRKRKESALGQQTTCWSLFTAFKQSK